MCARIDSAFSIAGLICIVLILTTAAWAKSPTQVDLPYIVELKPISQSPKPLTGSAQGKAIDRQQQAFLRSAGRLLGQEITPLYRYSRALNGMALAISPQQAYRLKHHPDVIHIERSVIHPLTTDSGPVWVGADQVWSGTGTQLPYQGEGVIIGVLDTGVNTDHPSFALESADGYVHQNPKSGYLGDCVNEPSLCNDKLIGVYSYDDITGEYATLAPGTPENGEDHNGHGSHVAGIAAGNSNYDVPIIDASDTPNPAMTFERISGVAPRANIISYQVCQAGDPGDGIEFDGCPTHLVLEAIDQAIADEVDVINHSIGASAQSPWSGSKGKAFLKAQNAGITMVHSAGNDGPASETASSDASAPWVISVAAFTHDRAISDKTIGNFSGGSSTLSPITGRALTGGITAPIVYAGNIDNPNSDDDPALCLAAFPNDTFNGEIVVCDRGTIARVDKAKNVKAGGAGGFVLANVGNNNLVADAHVLPAIHINRDDGDRLKEWLAQGSEQFATIEASEFISSPERANQAAGFSSRGPNNLVPDVLSPTLSAPGVNIWSAYADDQPAGFKSTPAPKNYAFLNGTSMAAPHVAGAAALLSGLHPQWSPAEIQSALVLTADSNTVKEDTITPASYFDMGAGMIDVAAAAKAGLVLDISAQQFASADPNLGGEPEMLNLASLTDSQCVSQCQWQREIKATQNQNWSVGTATNSQHLSITVTPQTFSLDTDQTQTIEITASINSGEANRWYFGQVILTSSSQQLVMPVSVLKTTGNLPETLSFTAHRDRDTRLVPALKTIAADPLSLTAFDLVQPDEQQGSVAEDSDNSSPFDDTSDGVVARWLSLEDSTPRLVVDTIASTAPDIDLYVGLDDNNDGLTQASEMLASSTSPDAIEHIDLRHLAAGDYWILIQNWQGSGSAQDSFTYSQAVIGNNTKDNLLATASRQAVDRFEPWSLRLNWSVGDASKGERLYGAVAVGTSTDATDDIGLIAVNLTRGENDVSIATLPSDRVAPGSTLQANANVLPNRTSEARQYQLSVTLPSPLTPEVTDQGTVQGQLISWQFEHPAGSSARQLPFDIRIPQEAGGGAVDVSLSSGLTAPVDTAQLYSQTLAVEIEGPPQVDISGNTQVTGGSSVTLTAVASDPNDDPIEYQWRQTSGPDVSLNGDDTSSVGFTAPEVSDRTSIGLQLQVSDDRNNSTSEQVTVTVSPPVQSESGSGGGSYGALLVGLLCFLAVRRWH